MPISSAGNRRYGITLIELLVVMAIVSLLVGVTVPAATNGLASIRLRSAATDVASFITSALNRAERHEQLMEIIIYPKQSRLDLDSTEPGYFRRLTLPEDVRIAGEQPIRLVMMPGSAAPRLTIDLFNDRGAHRLVRLDPVTGVAEMVIPK